MNRNCWVFHRVEESATPAEGRATRVKRDRRRAAVEVVAAREEEEEERKEDEEERKELERDERNMVTDGGRIRWKDLSSGTPVETEMVFVQKADHLSE